MLLTDLRAARIGRPGEKRFVRQAVKEYIAIVPEQVTDAAHQDITGLLQIHKKSLNPKRTAFSRRACLAQIAAKMSRNRDAAVVLFCGKDEAPCGKRS